MTQNPKKCCEKCWTNHPSHPEGGYCSDYICTCHSKNVEEKCACDPQYNIECHHHRTQRKAEEVAPAKNVGEKHKECGDSLCWCFRGMADKVAETSKKVGERCHKCQDLENLAIVELTKDGNCKYCGRPVGLNPWAENTPGGDTGWESRFDEEFSKYNASILNEFQLQMKPDLPMICFDERVALIPAIDSAIKGNTLKSFIEREIAAAVEAEKMYQLGERGLAMAQAEKEGAAEERERILAALDKEQKRLDDLYFGMDVQPVGLTLDVPRAFDNLRSLLKDLDL